MAFKAEPGTIGHAYCLAKLLVAVGRSDEAAAVLRQGIDHDAPDYEILVELQQALEQ